MSTEFNGTRDVTVDGAGRIKLPSIFRRVFDDNGYGSDVVVAFRTVDGKGFMMIYPERAWRRSLEHLSELPGLSALEAEAIRRKLNRQSEMGSMDRQGRIMLPKRFAEPAAVNSGDEVALIGSGNRIEVWNTAVCDRVVEETEVDDEKIASVLNAK